MRRRTILLAVGLAAVLAAGAHAQTLTYDHEGEPLFSITYPSGWLIDLNFRQEAEEAGAIEPGEEPALRVVEARPGDDRHLWVGLWVVPDVASLEEAVDYFASLRQELFTDVELSPIEELELGGMPGRGATGTAKREGESVELRIALFQPRAGVVGAALYVGKPDAWRLYRDELEAMAASIRPAG